MTAPTPPPTTVAPELASIANLTASLRSDYAALQNDLAQAQEMAADFQRQLAGKSNEVAHFKGLLEKTLQDLVRMEGHISELRQERHRLANEVMVGMGLKEMVEKLRSERDQLRRNIEEMRNSRISEEADHQEQLKLQETEIGRLRVALEAARNTQIPTGPTAGEVAAGVRDRISELSATVERLECLMREHPSRGGAPSKGASDGFIDIPFEP